MSQYFENATTAPELVSVLDETTDSIHTGMYIALFSPLFIIRKNNE